MTQMKRNLIKNKNGSALVYVMFAMVLVLLMTSIVVTITMGNTRQASEQETGMQAYYIARSGVEAAYEALLNTSPSLLTGTDSFKTNVNKVLTDTLDFGDGTAAIKVTSNGSGDLQKVKIESLGTVKGVERTVVMEFYLNYDKYPDMVWSK